MYQKLARICIPALAAFAMAAPWSAAHAVGTAAGTTITNNATANYSINGVAATATTSTVSIRVDELISVRVTAPATTTSVIPGDINKVLAFTITNVGNGSESYTLTPNLGVTVGDNFDPTVGTAGQLFLDVNNNGILDAGDTLITAPITLTADQTVKVLVVSNIPGTVLNAQTAIVTLTAESTTVGAAGAAPGTILTNLGTPTVGGGTIDAIVGVGPGGAADSGSNDAANGTYVVTAVTVTVTKVVLSVTNPFGVTTSGCNVASPPAGCSAFVPGSIIQYQVTVTIAGTGTAQAVTIIDNVPANTTYVANSIRFNTLARTDVVDGDNTSCSGCGNAVGSIAVVVGDVAVAGTPVVHNIDYKISVN